MSDEVNWAIRTVARQVIANMTREASWEDYPEIGSEDWSWIIDEAFMRTPDEEGFADAYKLLADRAEGVEA